MSSVKRLAILGCTGSIGQSALSVVDTHSERLDVVGRAIAGGAEVSIVLTSGPRLTFRNLDDHTIYYSA